MKGKQSLSPFNTIGGGRNYLVFTQMLFLDDYSQNVKFTIIQNCYILDFVLIVFFKAKLTVNATGCGFDRHSMK